MRLLSWLIIGLISLLSLAIGCAKWLKWVRHQVFGIDAWENKPYSEPWAPYGEDE